MRKALPLFAFLSIALFVLISNFGLNEKADKAETRNAGESKTLFREIASSVGAGDTLFDIFKRHGLSIEELLTMREASADVYRLKKLNTGRPYTIKLDGENRVRSFTYSIDDDSTLSIERRGEGFIARRVDVEYETRIVHLGGAIKDNLISSMDDLNLALEVSDIFAWDIDFNTDLREGDTFKVVVEGLYAEGNLRKYGRVLSAEFSNDGAIYRAYRFEHDGKADYYDDDGKSLKRAFLKAPLSFRRISSGFTKRRLHPILRTYRPHLGVDYSASSGTPVSAPASGTVIYRGHKGANGNLIIMRHKNGYTTYYGHLRGFAKGMKSGSHVEQGQVIGYVGSTGRATGPHLDYRVKHNGRFINPLTLKPPRMDSIPKSLMAEFKDIKAMMSGRLASIIVPRIVEKAGEKG
jgi:murein DD-endopeptidase MepM/ murein hydrolase activator NlpD